MNTIQTFYGIFRIETKEISGFRNNTLFTASSDIVTTDMCEIFKAHDTAFQTEEEAKQMILNLPNQSIYVIMPIYLSL